MSEKDIKKLKDKVKMAVDLFMKNDRELLQIGEGVHEQSISHRIAVYLEYLLKGFNIDCEYNKHLDQSKRVDLNNLRVDDFRECDCEACKKIVKNQIQDIKEKLFRPDIIVHKRGNDEDNRIAIEIKKGKECLFDQEKLRALVDNNGDYKYNLGVFIYFPENKSKVKWFVYGKKIEVEQL